MKALFMMIGIISAGFSSFAHNSTIVNWSESDATGSIQNEKDEVYLHVSSPLPIKGNLFQHKTFSCYAAKANETCNLAALKEILNKKVYAILSITTHKSNGCFRYNYYCDDFDQIKTTETLSLEFANGLVLKSSLSKYDNSK